MTEQANQPPDPEIFEQLLEEAQRTDLSNIEKRNVIYCCGMHEGDINGQHLKMPVIVFIPYHLDTETPDDLHKGLLLFIKVMNQITNMPYILIYCHAGMSFFNRSYFSWFKNTLTSLPRRFRKNIKMLRILHPSFTIRLFFAFLKPFISSKFYRKIYYDYSVEDLKAQFLDISLNLPHWLISYEDGILEPRNAVIKEVKDENFKIDLLSFYQSHNNTLPPYFEECIKFLEDYYDVEHLLRVPGSAKIVKESIHLILNENKKLSELPDFSKITCHEVSSILKNLLRQLSIPLVPKSYYEEIKEINQNTNMNSESSVKEEEEKYKNIWIDILTHICDSNKSLLLLLFKFYHELSKHSERNHMNTTAISAVITMGGYVVRSENEMDDVTYFAPIAKFSSVFIDEYDEIISRI